VVQEFFFPASRFGGLMNEDFTHVGMVETVERHYGITLEWANNTISVARAATMLADLLGIKTGDPVLKIETVMYDDAGDKVTAGVSWFRPDKFGLKPHTEGAKRTILFHAWTVHFPGLAPGQFRSAHPPVDSPAGSITTGAIFTSRAN
jgi:hypothetical protein